MEYEQYVTKHTTQIGAIKLTYTYERAVNSSQWELDDLYVTVNGTQIRIPTHWKRQTSSTIIRKLCAMYK